MKNILLGGGSGFIGTSIANLLRSKGYAVTIISRMPGPQRISWTDLDKNGIPENVNAVVNLAGQNVLDPTRRWTPGFKQNVWNSRVNTTKALSDAIISAPKKPDVFVTISGVGFYEPSQTTEYTEDDQGNDSDFFSRLCTEWENAAKLPPEINVRQVTIRSGVVIGRDGGMIKQLFLPFYLGLGGPIGTGDQFLPWIHIDDISKLFVFAIENNEVVGVLNGVAPQVITNREFSKSFARALWRPAIIPIPEFLIYIAFHEERGRMLTKGQKVHPKRTLSYGFKYNYPDIDSACKEVARLI